MCYKVQFRYNIDLTTESERTLLGHKVQGKYVYPASGFIYLIWKSYAKMIGYSNVEECPVQFTNIKFLTQITMDASDKLQFTVEINQLTGLFQLTESSRVICTGCVESLSTMVQFKQPAQTLSYNEETICQSEIYQRLRQRGYEINAECQPISKACVNGATAELMWNGRWINLLDGMIQMSQLAQNSETCCLPTMIRSIRIEPSLVQKQQRTVRFQDENNNCLNANWLQEEYQYFVRSAPRQQQVNNNFTVESYP